MTDYIAALPMYDWPECQAEVDAEWQKLRDEIRDAGIWAPEALARRNADLLPVPGGIRDCDGDDLAPDPATLPADELDLHTLWRHPRLLFGQTCWGPMELGLDRHVQVLGQPDYSDVEGGLGEFYSSAIVMRADTPGAVQAEPGERIPVDLFRNRRFAFNGSDSMSGVTALARDLERIGESLDIFSDRVLSGGHRNSIIAVASDEADVAAIDCRSWALARRFEPAAERLIVVGWTSPRKGLPYIASRRVPAAISQSIQQLIGKSEYL